MHAPYQQLRPPVRCRALCSRACLASLRRLQVLTVSQSETCRQKRAKHTSVRRSLPGSDPVLTLLRSECVRIALRRQVPRSCKQETLLVIHPQCMQQKTRTGTGGALTGQGGTAWPGCATGASPPAPWPTVSACQVTILGSVYATASSTLACMSLVRSSPSTAHGLSACPMTASPAVACPTNKYTLASYIAATVPQDRSVCARVEPAWQTRSSFTPHHSVALALRTEGHFTVCSNLR